MLKLSCHKLFLARLQVERPCISFTRQKGEGDSYEIFWLWV